MNSSRERPTCAAAQLVEQAGAGAPLLVMVHAASQDRRVFCAQVPVFAPHFRLLLPDLAGHGDSAGIRGPYDAETQVQAVSAAIDACGGGPFHYWGTHTGAGVGLMLAQRMPGRLLSLVLEGAVRPDALPGSAVRMMAECRDVARRDGLPAARDHWFDTSPWFDVMRAEPDRCRAAQHRAIVDAFNGSLWLDETPARPVAFDLATAAAGAPRTLLLNGEDDVPDFLEQAREIAGVLRDARQVTIPGGGGFPLWEAPEAVNAEVSRFLG